MQGVEEIEVRPFSSREEYELMLNYFYKAGDSFLCGIGVDRLKLPERDKLLDALLPIMRNQTGKGIGFTWFGYFKDSVLDTQVSIRSWLARRPLYICICGIHS
jgi:hypothetical protein